MPKVTHLTKNVPPQKSRTGNASRLEGDGAAMMRPAMEKYPPQKSRTGNASWLEGDGAASMGHTCKNEGREVEGAEDPPQMEAENWTRATDPIHI